jgi:carbonic anhydrase
MAIAQPVLWRTPPRLETTPAPDAYEMEVVRLSLDNLITFPWIQQAVEAGSLTLHGMRFDIATGVLWKLSETGPFVPVDAH